jgi:CRP-like cAMP-binding protein
VVTFQDPRLNLLLAALPPEDFAVIAASLEPATLRVGDFLYEPGMQMQHAWFPSTAIVSLHYVTSSGASSETAGVGHEGVVGIPLFMGGGSMLGSAVVQTGGQAFKLGRGLLKREFDRGGPMQHLLLRYTQTLIAQTTQTAACNRYHSVEQQLCRWLLLTLDRIPSGELTMTQELIGSMLGVRREGITEAAGRLQAAGHIRYRRGHIAVLSRAGLAARTCECYDVVKKETGRLMVSTHPSNPSNNHV